METVTGEVGHRRWRLGRGRWGYLQRGLRVGVQAHVAGDAFGVDPFSAFPQHYIDLHVHQQGDNERNVEGDDRRIHNKGRVGNDTLILLWKTQERAGMLPQPLGATVSLGVRRAVGARRATEVPLEMESHLHPFVLRNGPSKDEILHLRERTKEQLRLLLRFK